nr:immunoglobulin heavy chain junction region [Mus musculus]
CTLPRSNYGYYYAMDYW